MADQDIKIKLSELREIDFTALDFETLQEELIEYIKVAQSNQGIVDDFLSSDAALVFIDLFSYLGNILAFRIDTLSNENYLSTAQRRQSIINLLELVSQKVNNPTASSITLVAIPDSVSNSSIPIPARLTIGATGTDGSNISFEIMNEPTDYFNPVVIPAGVTNYEVPAFSGRYTTFDTVSTGEPNFEITLPEFPVIEGSIRVSTTPVSASQLTPEIIRSTRSTAVTSLVTEETDAIIYKEQNDEDGRVTLTFASSSFGKIPPKGDTIHVDYRVGGGANTNVSVGSVETSATLTNIGGETINVTFSNPDSAATGGQDAEDLETVRLRAPALVRANNNLVTTDDYEAIIADIGGVQDAFAVDAFQDNTRFTSKFGVPENSVFIWVLPDTGGEISPDLRQVISQELESRRLSAIENFIFSPVYNDWVLGATVDVLPTANVNDVRQAVTDALLTRFGRSTAQFKQTIRRSQVISTIQAVEGVDFVTLAQPAADIVADENEVLRLLPTNIGLFMRQD